MKTWQKLFLAASLLVPVGLKYQELVPLIYFPDTVSCMLYSKVINENFEDCYSLKVNTDIGEKILEPYDDLVETVDSLLNKNSQFMFEFNINTDRSGTLHYGIQSVRSYELEGKTHLVLSTEPVSILERYK